MGQKKFVDTEINVITGSQADILIGKKNDLQFLTDDGIIKVSAERWNEAQKYEKKTWMVQGIDGSDDHNVRNVNMLDNFRSISAEKPESLIELGCGPFTNARLFLENFPSVQKVTLVDPLAYSYLKHPHCPYKEGGLAGRKAEIISLPIEQISSEEKYDVVMIINVLEHCYDVESILAKVKSLMKKGTIFIFSDMMLDIEVIRRMTENAWDAGHPIRIAKGYMERFLSLFDIIYRKDTMPILNTDLDGGYEATWFYLIGRFKG